MNIDELLLNNEIVSKDFSITKNNVTKSYLESFSSSNIPTLSRLLYFIPSDLMGTLDLL